jgi:hypothetical protein
MGEAQQRWEEIRARMRENLEQAPQDENAEERARAMTKAMYDLANDLTYPVDGDGNVMNLHWLIPFLSFHLARCGYRKDEEAAAIKQIPHPKRGEAGYAEDAVLYVPVDATGVMPDCFLATPQEAPVDADIPWHTKTHITYNGETIKGGPR